MRKDIINIANQLAINQGLDFEIMKAYELIEFYCQTNKVNPYSLDIKINNGAMFIGNKFIDRVAPLKNKIQYDEQIYYIEGKILARQECETL